MTAKMKIRLNGAWKTATLARSLADSSARGYIISLMYVIVSEGKDSGENIQYNNLLCEDKPHRM
jgi:hypothetical protein